MIFLFFFLLAVVTFIFSLKAAAPKLNEWADKEGEPWVSSGMFWKLLIVPIVFIIFGMINPFVLQRVDVGNVGVKAYLTGDARGIGKYEYKNGWIVYNSWVSKLYEFPTYQQHIEYDEQSMIAKGGFTVTIKPSFNYSLKPGDVGDMFQNLRLDVKHIEQQWLQNAIISSVNDVTNKWTVDEIFNSRERFESDIVVECNKRLAKWFIISQLRSNITPPKALQESIEAKTKAIQEVQVAENQQKVAVADAQRKIATARGDSAQAVIAASGEANAIKLKQVSLTPEYIDYLKVQKWDGVLPQVTSGNSGILMNLGNKQ